MPLIYNQYIWITVIVGQENNDYDYWKTEEYTLSCLWLVQGSSNQLDKSKFCLLYTNTFLYVLPLYKSRKQNIGTLSCRKMWNIVKKYQYIDIRNC